MATSAIKTNAIHEAILEKVLEGEFSYAAQGTYIQREDIPDTAVWAILREASEEEDCDSVETALRRLQRMQEDISEAIEAVEALTIGWDFKSNLEAALGIGLKEIPAQHVYADEGHAVFVSTDITAYPRAIDAVYDLEKDMIQIMVIENDFEISDLSDALDHMEALNDTFRIPLEFNDKILVDLSDLREPEVHIEARIRITSPERLASFVHEASGETGDLPEGVTLAETLAAFGAHHLVSLPCSLEEAGLSEILVRHQEPDNEGMTLDIKVTIEDRKKFTSAVRSAYCDCWSNETWVPMNSNEALYELALASNANPSPDDIGIELASYADVESGAALTPEKDEDSPTP